MSKGGGTKTEYVTSERTNEPAAFIKPFMEFGADEARRLYESNLPEYFPQSTVVEFSPQTDVALRGIEERAAAGSPLADAAINTAQNTIAGNFLSGSNPYLEAALKPARDIVQSTFAGSGRLGSGANAEALANATNQIAFQNYNAERARQQQALGMVPTLQDAAYDPFRRLAGVGAAREAKAGEALQAAVNRHNFLQNVQADKLARYQALVGGGQFGGTSTESKPIFSNPAANFLGSTLGGGMIGNMFGMPGLGALGGGLLGLV